MKPFSIYKISYVKNGKPVYVGQTRKPLEERLDKHWQNSTVRNEQMSEMSLAIKRFGLDSFAIELIGAVNTQQLADYVEAQWIAKLNTNWPDGHNIRPGGIKYPNGERQKRLISAAHKKRPMTPERLEHLKNMRATIGPMTRETRMKHRIAMIGRKHSPETLAKLRGRTYSPEARANMAQAAKIRANLPENRKLYSERAAKQHRDGRFGA